MALISSPAPQPANTVWMIHRLFSGPRFVADGMVLAVLLGWWLLSAKMSPYVFPSVPAVLGSMLDLMTDPNVAQHTLASISRVILSVVIATALGTILAVLPRYVPSLHALVHERIKPFLNSFPSVGWAVLLTIWMDMSAASVVMTQVMILTPFCLINIAEGVRALDEELSEMGESFTRSPLRRLFRIDLPALVPFMLASVRMTYGVCWKIALLAELFGAQSGLGYLMQIAQDNADPALLFATCFMVVALFRLGEFLILDPLSRRYSWNDPEQVKSYV